MSIRHNDPTEARLIEEAIAAGRVRRFPPGATSNWDELPFRARRSLMARADYKMRSRRPSA